MKKSGISYRLPYILIAALLLFPPLITAQIQVYQPELMNHGNVEFINYEGPHFRIDTLQQIRAIGYDLGRMVGAGVARPGNLLRYFVIHSVSPADGNRLDADIFGIGADAAVDHIRNLRLIIQGYLEAAYQYSASDAALLAQYITIYNAVYRGDWDFFTSRYKNPVIGHLVRERVGLSLRYDEWPGQTLMLIPLGTGLGGQLSAIDTVAISDERVIDHLRQQPDMGIEQRRDMVDLMEREADAAAQQAVITREAIEQEEERIAQEIQEAQQQQQVAQQQQQQAQQQQQQIAEAARQPGADQQALAQQAQEAQEQQEMAQLQEQEALERQEELAQQQEALEDQRQLAEAQEAFAEERIDIAQAERQQLAEDMQVLIDIAPPPPFIAEGSTLGVSILSHASSLGRVVRIDAEGREIRRSPLTSVNVNTVNQVNNSLFAIAGENRGNAAIRLVEINEDTLEMVRHGDNDIAPGSLLWPNGQNLYAVIDTGGNLYMARFNTDLVLQARSSMTVHPFASVLFYDNYIMTQRADGSAVMLHAISMAERM